MNKVILMGRLTKDPELKYTSNNLAVSNFTLAVNRRFAKQGEERQADFINIVAFEKTAEFTNTYFKKGMQVAVTGRLQIRTWDDPDGKRNYFTEVVIDEAHFADTKRDDYTSGAPARVESKPSGNNEGFYPVSEDDDELPF